MQHHPKQRHNSIEQELSDIVIFMNCKFCGNKASIGLRSGFGSSFWNNKNGVLI